MHYPRSGSGTCTNKCLLQVPYLNETGPRQVPLPLASLRLPAPPICWCRSTATDLPLLLCSVDVNVSCLAEVILPRGRVLPVCGWSHQV